MKNENRAFKSMNQSHNLIHEMMEGDAPFIVDEIVHEVVKALDNGHKVIICGNGGSAADASHMAAELVGRFKRDRKGLAAIALSDTANMSAIANDYGYENVFSRQINALGKEDDVLICLSTSGSSKNVVNAALEGKEKDMRVISITGLASNFVSNESHVSLTIPSVNTARIQEATILLIHCICDAVETYYVPN